MISDERLEVIAAHGRESIFPVTPDDCSAMAKELLALRKAFSEPVAFQNNYTGKLWRPDQQPGAEQDTDVYTPLYRKPTDSAT